ncbi:hypothetical protein D9M68_926910 [compost metagenome]
MASLPPVLQPFARLALMSAIVQIVPSAKRICSIWSSLLPVSVLTIINSSLVPAKRSTSEDGERLSAEMETSAGT